MSSSPSPVDAISAPGVGESALELDSIELAGCRLADTTESGCVEHIITALGRGIGGWVVTVNADIALQAQRRPEVRRLVDLATVRVADGMPLVWAARLQRTPLPERVAGSSLVWRLSQRLAEEGRSLYLLGGAPGVAKQAAEVLQNTYPTMRIAGVHCPPFGFESDPRAMEQIRSALVAAKPDVVLVALGAPKQERLTEQQRPLLPQAWFLGVGISLSFIAGDVHRAPRWMQACGLEWLHRMLQEPGRLVRRYLIDDIPFVLRLLCGAAASGIRKRTTARLLGRGDPTPKKSS